MSWVELTATVFGFLCVLFTIRRSVWCWPTGLVQVSLFIIVFYDAKLYSDLLLHVVYVLLQFYGWYCWTRKDACDESLIVRSLPMQWVGGWIIATVAGTMVLGWAMARWTDASLPYPDAFTTTASLVAQLMLARRYVQNWAFLDLCRCCCHLGLLHERTQCHRNSLHRVFSHGVHWACDLD